MLEVAELAAVVLQLITQCESMNPFEYLNQHIDIHVHQRQQTDISVSTTNGSAMAASTNGAYVRTTVCAGRTV